MPTFAHLSGSTPETWLAELPPLDWRRVSQIQLIRRVVREVMSPSALELLFAHSDHVVETGVDAGDPTRLYATVMVTMDLQRCRESLREPVDPATAQRVAELLVEARVRRRLAELAARQLSERAGREIPPDAIDLELSVRVDGCSILIDADAVTSSAALRAAERSR